MELALSTRVFSCRGVGCLTSSHKERLLFGHSKPINLVLPRYPPSPSTLVCSRRRNHRPAVTSSSSKNKNKKIRPKKDDAGDDFEDDPFEALFSLLEEDLKNDDSVVDDDNEINEEDIDKLACELEEALGDIDMEMSNTDTTGTESDCDDAQEIVVAEEEEEEEEEEDDDDEDEDEDEDDEDEEKEGQVRLKNWQRRKLAYALKTGRRKTSIKNLAAELCLDRAVVLEILRDPPPSLLMMSAALPDEPTPRVSVPEVKPEETVMEETIVDAVELESKVKEPVHARQHRWFAQKRLKKVQVETLELVYRRSKRPTNALISSIVQVTNLPRRRIVKWFEDRRAEEGVPKRRAPYQRSDPETVFSS